MKSKLEEAKKGIVVELQRLGYTENEINQFKEKVVCPRCGLDFSSLPYSGRWLSHFSNCEGKRTK